MEAPVRADSMQGPNLRRPQSRFGDLSALGPQLATKSKGVLPRIDNPAAHRLPALRVDKDLQLIETLVPQPP